MMSEKAILVGLQLDKMHSQSIADSLNELELLAKTAGASIMDVVIQKRSSIDSGYFIGKGKAFQIAELAKKYKTDLIIFDDELSPSQTRNLEDIIQCRIIDRTTLILDIFSKNAKTREAKTQVDIAQLSYLLPRLVGQWTHLGRERGGIGLKGTGEKQIEIDRRLIKDRIAHLKKDLKSIEKERQTQRNLRKPFLKVALVGYTNAGKSTLMNNLTRSKFLVDDKLFATLDSSIRILNPPTTPKILITDTVGFIKKLPHSLIASFKSTLEEIDEADLLLHVIDVNHPIYKEQIDTTNQVLKELKLDKKPTFLIFNKIDLLKGSLFPKVLERSHQDSIAVSSLNPEDMIRLRDKIFSYFDQFMVEITVKIPYKNAKEISFIRQYAKILEEEYIENFIQFKLRTTKEYADRIESFWKKHTKS